MPLNLHPLIVGEPDWRLLQPGEPTTTVTQWYNLKANPRRWEVVPWFTSDGYLTLPENLYRVPVSRRAKWSAFWVAAPKWLRVKLLRIKDK